MIVVDGHLDLAWNALQWNRNLLDPVAVIRANESTLPERGRRLGTVALPQMRQGRIALCFATLLARSTGQPAPHIDYATPQQSHGIARGQLAYYRALAHAGHVRVITNASELSAHIVEWQAWDAEHSHVPAPGLDPDTGRPVLTPSTPPLGLVILMEGADPILDPGELSEWHAAGLRIIGLTHYGVGRYAGGTGTEAGLAEACAGLLHEMGRREIVLDLSHCSDAAFWQALRHFDGPVLASHNNCRALVPHQRQLDDEQIRAIMRRGGVIGVALDAWMLRPGWVIGQDDNLLHPQVALGDVIAHVDHICQLAGDAGHVAIGSDLDGGFGREASPYDLDTIADLQKIPALLQQRGYDLDDIAAITHGNWLGLLHRSWTS
jgi:membrane dipeptidase